MVINVYTNGFGLGMNRYFTVILRIGNVTIGAQNVAHYVLGVYRKLEIQ